MSDVISDCGLGGGGSAVCEEVAVGDVGSREVAERNTGVRTRVVGSRRC